MNKIGYVDLQSLCVEAEAEDSELLGLFRGQPIADRMIMILDGEALRLVEKTAVWAKVRASQIVREQEQRDADREQARMEHCREESRQKRQIAADRRKKRREDKARAAIAAAVAASVAACAGMLWAGAGNPLRLIGTIGGLLMVSGAAMARKAVQQCRQ